MEPVGQRFMHAQRIALNMLWCAFLLWPWGTWPRETISGFFGRNAVKHRVAFYIARFIDWLHPQEPNHCGVTAWMEHEARIRLGYHE